MSKFLESINALRTTDYERRIRVCANCNNQYSDVTRRSTSKCCSPECSSALMVTKRKANGSYVQTDEQKEKLRLSVKATFASRDCFSPETRKIFSETMKRTWAEGRISTENHWAKKPEARKKLSENAKKQVYTLDMRRNMSLAARNRLRTKRETLYTSAKGGHRDDLGMYFRSNWEANFARIMNLQGKIWHYEPHTFDISHTESYTPDFFVDGTYYEVKGRLTDACQRKINLFREQNPQHTLVIVDGAHYDRLRLEFKHLIPFWEGK